MRNETRPATPPLDMLSFFSQRGRRNHQRLFRSRSSLSPPSRSPGGGGGEDGGREDGVGRGGAGGRESSSLTPPRSRGSASSSLHSLRRSSFRETAKVVKRKLNNGTVIINKYRIISELGRGSYGSVHLCRDGDTGIVSFCAGVDFSLLFLGGTGRSKLGYCGLKRRERTVHSEAGRPAEGSGACACARAITRSTHM